MNCRLGLLVLFLLPTFATAADSARSTRSLDGPWQFRRDTSPPGTWKTVTVPSAMQTHEGTAWHGIGWYRKTLGPITVPAGHRLLLHFQAAATQAQVFWNGEKLGEHLGGWTPFRFDVTEAVRKAKPGTNQEILVRLDEKVGHNTQGFLPVIQPHFGGLWQSVSLIEVPDVYIDDLTIQPQGDAKAGRLQVLFDLRGRAEADVPDVKVRWRPPGQKEWTEPPDNKLVDGRREGRVTFVLFNNGRGEMVTQPTAVTIVPPKGLKLWSPAAPNLYEIEITITPSGKGAVPDTIRTRIAARSVTTDGPKLLLNGRPIIVRGVLTWGHYPSNLAPNPGEAELRRELQLAKAMGFNLYKCCLWVPPQRLLELADEMGMLVWMEYPTWRPNFDAAHLPALTREFEEFFAYDRGHPSVILRSLTCETGQTTDSKVMRDLFDRCKREAPGALVEDDSAWIDWNRFFDFYDDHTYGNNHDWVANLHRLRDHIAKSPQGAKPLLLGEAIGADTWTPYEPLAAKVGDKRPWWMPGFFDANRQWLDQMRAIAGPIDEKRFVEESKRYAFLMRKYQIETFRREFPYGGYVVGAWRDFPLSAMGLLDYLGQPKWKPEEWKWHGDTQLLLTTNGDRRTFTSGEKARLRFLASHFGHHPLRDVKFTVVYADPPLKEGQFFFTEATRQLSELVRPGSIVSGNEFDWSVPTVDHPTPIDFEARLAAPGDSEIRNEWRLWVLPKSGSRPKGVTIVHHLDPKTLDLLEAGGKVLLLPDGGPNSPRLRPHWFMRGGPFIANHPALKNVPRELIVETQHFDLAGEVMTDINFFDQIDPIVMLWENHDIKEVKTHALVYETRVGKGRLLVSALKHDGPTNAAGRYLLDEFIKHLATGPEPRHALNAATLAQLRRSVSGGKIDLVGKPWRFRPDPNVEGLKRGWHRPDFHIDDSWKPIRIDQHWERQGYPLLDGWAWYRLKIPVPADWAGKEIYVTFEGVDDEYELYVNGQKAGRGGDPVTRVNAFHEKKSHRITPYVKPGQTCLIAVRVNDWYGAGGIFRPVTLGTVPFVPGEPEIVR